MKAILLFEINRTVFLETGDKLVLFLDCYQLTKETEPFSKAFRFSWIAFKAGKEECRVLMDQHPGKKAHIHYGDKEVTIDVHFNNKEEALEYFFAAVEKHFGPISEEEKE